MTQRTQPRSKADSTIEVYDPDTGEVIDPMAVVIECEQALKIDRNNLEAMHTEQPELYYQVSKLYTLVMSLRDEAERQHKEAEAESDLEFRKDFTEAEEKFTEAQVKAEVLRDEDVIKAYKRYAKLKSLTGRLYALKDAFDKRDKALEQLTKLYLSQYYYAKDTGVGGTRRDVRDLRAEEARRDLDVARQRRRAEGSL